MLAGVVLVLQWLLLAEPHAFDENAKPAAAAFVVVDRAVNGAKRRGLGLEDVPDADVIEVPAAFEQIVAYMSSPTIFLNGGVETTFGDITAEDDRVAVEVETKGTLPDGRVYTNVYHYLMKFRDGKIIRVKEYLDTQSAAEFFSK